VAVIKRMASKAKIAKIEKYVKDPNKTEEKLISGINCGSDNFAKQCEMTNLLYSKNQNQDDRKYYHIVQSFSPKDNGKLTYEQAHKIGIEFAKENFKGHEVLVVTHKDKDHIHNHLIVNSVNLENGKKYRADNRSLWRLRRTSNELCKQNGLTNSIQPLEKRAKDKLTSGEVRKALRGEKVWKIELKAQITECASTSKNEAEFKAKMQEKYNVTVTERVRKSKGVESKIYEYKSPSMKKPCGEHRLGEGYELCGREFIRSGFTRRSEAEAGAENTRAVRAGQQFIDRTTGGADTETLIREARASADSARATVADSTAGRADREAQQQRFGTQRSRENEIREPNGKERGYDRN